MQEAERPASHAYVARSSAVLSHKSTIASTVYEKATLQEKILYIQTQTAVLWCTNVETCVRVEKPAFSFTSATAHLLTLKHLLEMKCFISNFKPFRSEMNNTLKII